MITQVIISGTFYKSTCTYKTYICLSVCQCMYMYSSINDEEKETELTEDKIMTLS